MKITVAGFNIDIENCSDSPETISAAYARISRDPRPISELRASAANALEKARSSNRTIIFEYGHGSVAEHAVFNFDILDLSRLCTEALQSFRLASFTEKSQRYIRLGEDWHLPEGLSPEESSVYCNTVERLFDFYKLAFDVLKESGMSTDTAKEDARYLLPLATTCQMGMTANARELEHMFRRLAAHPLAEVRELGRILMEKASSVAPSLFLFTEPTEMDRFAHALPHVTDPPSEAVVLISSDNDAKVGAHLIQIEKGISLANAEEVWKDLDDDSRIRLFDRVYDGLGIHDQPPRCWEAFLSTFEVIVSATAFAQLKRHRMCTQLVSCYEPELGCTEPPSFVEAGLSSLFSEAMDLSLKGSEMCGTRGTYLLTNSHRRRVTIHMNGRELYHFSRLREDSHAQWDIRSIAGMMLGILRQRAPLTMKMSGGKSERQDLS